MYKALVFNCFAIVLLVSTTFFLPAQELMHPRSPDLVEQVEHGLYRNALSAFAIEEPDLYDVMASDEETQALLEAYLSTRYPEWMYRVSLSDKSLRKSELITQKINEIIQQESAIGLFKDENEMEAYAIKLGLDEKQRVSLSFFKGYELFKQKRYAEADKIFNKVIRQRGPQQEFALYYAGMGAFIQGQWQIAGTRFSRIKGPPRLVNHLPYYVAAIYYAQRQYDAVIQKFEPRLGESGLYRRDDLQQLVALSHYQLEQWEKAIRHLSASHSRDRELRLLLADAYSHIQRSDKASPIYESLRKDSGAFGDEVNYRYALAASSWGNPRLAIEILQELDGKEHIFGNAVRWNLAMLTASTGDYQKSCEYTSQLLETDYGPAASEHMQGLLEKLKSDEASFLAAVEAIKQASADPRQAAETVYDKALEALKVGNGPTAEQYFQLLTSMDPSGRFTGRINAWQGILAYQRGQYNPAQRHLSVYLNDANASPKDGKLFFDAHYFMGYACFKIKDHGRALGFLSKAKDVLETTSAGSGEWNKSVLAEDVLVRLGDVYVLTGDYDQAESTYAAASERPKYQGDYILFQRGRIAGLKKRTYDAILFFDQLESEYPDSKYLDGAKFEKAGALFALGKYERASREYLYLKDRAGDQQMRELSWLQLGLIHTNKGDFEKAIEYFTTAQESADSPAVVATAGRALAEIYSEHTFDTNAYLDLVTSGPSQELGSSTPDSVLFFLAKKNFNEKNWSIAYEQFEKLVDEFPSSLLKASSIRHQAEILYNTQRPALAADKYESILALTAPESEEYLDARDRYEQLVFDELKDYSRFIRYATTYRALNTDKTQMQWVFSTLFTDQFNTDDRERLLNVLKSAEIPTSEKDNLLNIVVRREMKSQNWAGVSTLLGEPAAVSFLGESPRLIYSNALASTNQGDYTQAVQVITSNYDVLKKDAAWLAKSIILLSDNYVIQGENNAALAALEALAGTKGKFADSLGSIIENRLENLRIHIKFIESQKQHGDE